MKKIIFALLIISVISTSSVMAQITDQERENAINGGLEYLANQQNPSTGVVDDLGYPVALTAFAVLKWSEHAKKSQPKIDPFSDTYTYKDNIVAGLNYLFSQAHAQSIGMQDAGDPDTDTDGIGIYFASPGRDRYLYETGIVMMAIEATCHPDRQVTTGPFAGQTYQSVMVDLMNYIAWAQNEGASPGPRGGWRYGPNHGSSDNSVSQWPALGLLSAGAWGIHAPNWVKTELLNFWLSFSQDVDGGFWYTGPGSWKNVGLTGAGMIELTYCGKQTNDQEMIDAMDYICMNWVTGGDHPNIGSLYHMYGVTKAAVIAQPDTVWDFCGHKWQDEYDEWLVAEQILPDGYWPGHYANKGPGSVDSRILATEFALLILQKSAPPPPPPIPVLGNLTLLILILLLVGAGVIILRKRIKFASN